jgi:hypothetical protein
VATVGVVHGGTNVPARILLRMSSATASAWILLVISFPTYLLRLNRYAVLFQQKLKCHGCGHFAQLRRGHRVCHLEVRTGIAGLRLMTSNRPVDDWGKLLGDTAAVNALLDRLLHHAHVLKCGPRSWRTKVQTDLRPEEGVR